ncbi:MAG: hypothetical protein R3C05_27720 [Pirellulaceae bacterium]
MVTWNHLVVADRVDGSGDARVEREMVIGFMTVDLFSRCTTVSSTIFTGATGSLTGPSYVLDNRMPEAGCR